MQAIKTSFFYPYSMVKVPALSQFIAKTNLAGGFRGDYKKIRVAHISEDFLSSFEGKVEKPTDAQEVNYALVRTRAVDQHFLKEIGGEEIAETTLSTLLYFLKEQWNGGEGVLQVGGLANLFYIRNTAGKLRAVCVYWTQNGWYIMDFSLEDLKPWSEGTLVFYRAVA